MVVDVNYASSGFPRALVLWFDAFKGPHVPPFKLGLSPIVTCTCSGLVDDIPSLILPNLGVNPRMPARTTLKPLEKAARQPEDLVR